MALLLGACGQNQNTTPTSTANSKVVLPQPASLADGERVYRQSCFACHDTGAAGAPKRGDKTAWAPRIATGQTALYTAALQGMNAMPPRGGSGASDAEILAAVNYLLAPSK
jgi:cytochrome c5